MMPVEWSSHPDHKLKRKKCVCRDVQCTLHSTLLQWNFCHGTPEPTRGQAERKREHEKKFFEKRKQSSAVFWVNAQFNREQKR